MADVAPFRSYHYSTKAGRLEDLVTQPYDKISPAMQQRYLSLNPYNLVRIILGERFPSDSAQENVYTRAAGYLKRWTAEGILVQDAEPAFFAYFQEFTVPDTGERLLRKGFVGVGAVEDYADGVVHRHEQTLSGPKKDRLELLRHTRTHFGQVFMLYPDPKREVDAILDEVAAGEPSAAVVDEYEAVHRVWRISEPVLIASIQHAMHSKKLIIADGHHRYETALAFRNEHPEFKEAGRVMMTFVNMDSPGLRILATHRLVDEGDPEKLLVQARQSLRLEKIESLSVLQRAWAEPHPGRVRLGMAAGSGLYLLEAGRAPGQLDVPFLHERILRDMLGISEEEVKLGKRIRYVRGADAALEAVQSGDATLGFLLEATAIQDVGRIAFSGGVMPQKSTDFYPKLLSGLAIYRVES